MDRNVDQDLNVKINLLNNTKQNQEFIRLLKVVIEYQDQLDLATTEKRIFKNVLSATENQFNRVYNDNFSLFETLDDEVMSMLIKENLEAAFELTETLQEILNNIYQHSPVNVNDIESVLKYIPSCILLFAHHWRNSSEIYKNAFSTEISKLLEVIKHLHGSFLHILEFSVCIEDSNEELSLLAETLISICELPRALYDLDANSVISSWKCFSTVTAKYSLAMENCIDLRIPINGLCEDIYKVLETLSDHDGEVFAQQIQMITFLIKILFKLSDVFYQQLDTFALELLIFYIKILSLRPSHCKFSEESRLALDREVFKNVDVFLNHLVKGHSDFKNHLEKISDYMESMAVFKQHPFGLLNLLCKVLHIIAALSTDWCTTTIGFIETIFSILPLCERDFFLEGYESSIYEKLIIDMSSAILLQDERFQCAEILLRHILQEDVFAAVLALEIYTLIVSNLPPEENVSLLINLLYGVNNLQCGFFTHRPGMVYLKILLQRIFQILPDTLKDEIIKIFSPEQYIQIWTFLGFRSLPAHQVQLIVSPVIRNTSECMGSIVDTCNGDMPLNIAEGLVLLSTVNDLDTNNPRFSEITKFLDSFWASDFNDNEILENNIMKYFILKITGMTSTCIQNSSLDIQRVFAKLKTISCKESYWVPVYKIIHSILYSLPLMSIPDINKEGIVKQIASIVTLPVQNKANPILRETYLELFKNINESQKSIVNFLLDSFNRNISNQIFQYLEKFSAKTSIVIDFKHSKIAFTHKCLNWKDSINATISPKLKRAKMEVPLSQVRTQVLVENVSIIPVRNKTFKIKTNEKTKEQKENISTFTEEDDSTAAEVIDRIKGEVKCLVKICKTEKLTQKNIANLRIIMSQMSSLM